MSLGIERQLFRFLKEIGSIGIFLFKILKTLFKTGGNAKPIVDQVASITIRSLPIVGFAGIFVGGILVLQFNLILSEYDAQSFLGGLNTSAFTRAIGPLIISFLLAGKIGAYTAAELGTMRVTDQIDAIECLGTNPIQYLIIPRFMGIIISSIILLAIGVMVGIVGSMVIAKIACGMNFLEFTSSIPRFTSIGTILAGVFKSTVYGAVVALVCCYKGYTAKGGARGVGKAVTQAAVYTHFYIIFANYLTSDFIDLLETLTKAVIR